MVGEDPRVLGVLEGSGLTSWTGPWTDPGERFELQLGLDLRFLVVDVYLFIVVTPNEIQLEVSNEIPSDDGSWDICFDSLEFVGFASDLDINVLASEAFDLVAVDGVEAAFGSG